MITMRLLPTANVYLSEFYSNKNFANSPVLFIGRFRGVGDVYRTFFKFDVTSISPLDTIVSAKLKLFVYRKDASGDQTVIAYKPLGDAEQYSLNFNNQPEIVPTTDQVLIRDVDLNNYVELDITDLLLGWVNSTIAFTDLAIITDENVNNIIGFKSTIDPNSSQWPYIEVHLIPYLTPCPAGPSIPVSVNRIYTANYSSNNVSVINGFNNAIIATIPVGDKPYGVAVNPKTNRIYVENSSNISVIDGGSNTVIGTISVGGGNRNIVSMALLRNSIYVANYDTNYVSVIDENTNSTMTTITVGTQPIGIGVNPITNKLYVANNGGNSVSVIDGNTNSIIATITVGTKPSSVAVDPLTNEIYVANMKSNNVSVISGLSNAVIATVSVGDYPHIIRLNPISRRIYVTNYYDSTVSIIDGSSNTPIDTITVGLQPMGIAVNLLTNGIYVTNEHTNNVSVISGLSNTVVATIEVKNEPFAVGINP